MEEKGEDVLRLPDGPTKASCVNPRMMLLYSYPKIGKTSTLAQLENSIIIDMEEGTDFIDCTKVKVKSSKDLLAYVKLLQEERKYKYIVLDTGTKMQEVILPYAEQIYSKTLIGSKWFLKDKEGKLSPLSGKAKYGRITNLPKGAGYMFLKQAFMKIIYTLKDSCDCLIITAHVRTKANDDMEERDIEEADLIGSIKNVVTAEADAVCQMIRKNSENFLLFTNDNMESIQGTRAEHISGKQIMISKKENGKIVANWDEVFIKNK